MEIDGAGKNNPSDAEHETASRVRSLLLGFGSGAATAEEVNRRLQGERRERTAEEDEKLRNSVERFEGDWLRTGEHFKVPRISEGEGMDRCRYFLESSTTEKEDKVLNEYVNAIEGRITGRTAEQFVKRWLDDLKNRMNMKSGTEDAESGDFSGSKKFRSRSFSGSSSAASLLPRKLQRLSLQDRALAAASSSAAALYASALSQLCDEVAHQVEQTISSQRTARRVRSFRPRGSTQEMLRRCTAEEDDKLRHACEQFEGDWLKIGRDMNSCLGCATEREHFKERHLMNSSIKEGPWTEEEDELLLNYVNLIGPGHWVAIEGCIPGRTAEQCEKRWHDDLESSMNMKSLTRRFGSWDKADRDGSRRYRGRSLCESSSAGSLLPQSLQRLSLQDHALATAADASSSSAMARDSEEGVVNVEKKSGESCFSDCSPTS